MQRAWPFLVQDGRNAMLQCRKRVIKNGGCRKRRDEGNVPGKTTEKGDDGHFFGAVKGYREQAVGDVDGE